MSPLSTEGRKDGRRVCEDRARILKQNSQFENNIWLGKSGINREIGRQVQ